MLKSIFSFSDYWDWGTFIIYIFISFIVCILCKQGAKYKHIKASRYKKNILFSGGNIYYFSAFLILLLLATLRSYKVGPDTSVYVNWFNDAKGLDISLKNLFNLQQMEIGFQYYLKLMNGITSDYHIFFLFTYSIVSFSYIKFIKEYYEENSNYIFLEIFIFYYVANMSGMRSAIGTALLLQSILCFTKKKYVKSLFLTLFASLFHYTMLCNFIILFISYLLDNTKIFKKKSILAIALFLSVLVSFGLISSLKALFINTKYNYYSSVSMNDLSLLGSSVYLIFAILSIHHYKDIQNSYKNNNKLISLFHITNSFLLIYPAIFITSAYRIPYYYAMPRITIWSSFYSIIENKFKGYKDKLLFKIILQLIILLYLFYMFNKSSANGAFKYIIE